MLRRVVYKWALTRHLLEVQEAGFEKSGQVYAVLYRPLVPMYLYLSRTFNNCVYQLPQIWPTPEAKNLAIAVTGRGSRGFSALVVDRIVEYGSMGNT